MSEQIVGKLIDRLESRESVIGVLGLGYVGLPLAELFAKAGFRVFGFDPDEKKKEQLENGQSYIIDVESDSIKDLIRTGASEDSSSGIWAFSSFERLSDCDVVVICVPTPLAKTKDPDMTYILNAAQVVRSNIRHGQLVVLESTTYPGTTRELLIPMLSESKNGSGELKVGKDFFLAFSPERVDPGNEKFSIKNTPKVVGGSTEACLSTASKLYSAICDTVVPVSSTDAAELTKILENTFRAINIGLVNELAIICHRLGVDVWEVIDAASTKPFGFMPFYPGPGLGGHCIPVDPHYLSWKLRLLDYKARFIEVASDINGAMPSVVVERVVEALNSAEKSVKNSKIGIIGVSYKKDIDDMRESPALDICRLLTTREALLEYHDPFVEKFVLDDGSAIASSELSDNWLDSLDCAVIVTDHTDCDLEKVISRASLIVDTRNAVTRAGLDKEAGAKLFKL